MGVSPQTIFETALDIGVDAAAEKLGIKRETVRRKVRLYRQTESGQNGAPVDLKPADVMAQQLVERYSPEELRAMLLDTARLVPKHKASTREFSGEWFKFGIISDPHVGSKYTDDEKILSAIAEMNRAGCQELLIPGDITEGMSGRDGHISELNHIGYRKQRDAAVKIFSTFKGKISAISGNHDLWYYNRGNIGALVVEDICSLLPNAEYLGEHEGSITFNGARVDLWHGIDGASYAISYRIQKIVESLGEDTLPQLIIAGHDHKAEFIPDLRGVFAIEAGTMQKQTPFMRGKKLRAFVGFWIVEICVRDGKIIRIKPEWVKVR